MRRIHFWPVLLVAGVCVALALGQQRGSQARLFAARLSLGYDAVERDSSRGVLDTTRFVLNWAGILSDSATVTAEPDTAEGSRSRGFVRKLRGRHAEAVQATGGRFTVAGETYDTLGTWKTFTFERWAATHTISDTARGMDTLNWDVLARNRTGLTLVEFMTTPNDTGSIRAVGDTLRRDILEVSIYGDRQPREY